MTRRVALSALRMVVGTIVGIVIGVVATSGFLATRGIEAAQQGGRGQGAPATPPSPCGPKATLPENFSRNVAPNSRCFEIRMYWRTRAVTASVNSRVASTNCTSGSASKRSLFVKHGAEILGVWQHLDDPNTLVWMLAYRDRAHREQVWAAFGKIRSGTPCGRSISCVEDQHLPDERV